MRVLFLLVLLAGAALGLWPWAVQNFSGSQIGTWSVYRDGRFVAAEVGLSASDAPVRVLVDLTMWRPHAIRSGTALLAITGTYDGRVILDEGLSFRANPTPRQKSPQITERIFRDDAGIIDPVRTGNYRFAVRPGDKMDADIKAVDLVLRRETGSADARMLPAGLSLMGIGFIGLIVAFRRSGKRGRKENSAPPPRWGRDGGS